MAGENITWVDLDKGLPSVTIARYGITLNSTATGIISNFDIARVGYDKADKSLIIAMANLEDYEGKMPDGWFTIKEKITSHGYFRLNNKDLVRVVVKYGDLNLSKKNRFMAEWDQSQNFIIVDMTKTIKKDNIVSKKEDIFDTLMDLIY